jgi:hypothetical protein
VTNAATATKATANAPTERERRSPVPAAKSGTSPSGPNLVKPASAAAAPRAGGDEMTSSEQTISSATKESLKLEPSV